MILGFDTATAETTVAVSGEGRLYERFAGPDEDGRPSHGSVLLELIEAAVGESGGWATVTLIAVGLGPGSFTGLRIGVSTARALGQARGVPVTGIASTSALTAGLLDHRSALNRAVIGVIDARRGEVFAAADRGEGAGEPVVCAPEELAGALGGDIPGALAGGDGAVRFRAEIEAAGIEVLPDEDSANRLSARQVCALAARMAEPEPDGRERPFGLIPNYMRRPDAERWHERNNGN